MSPYSVTHSLLIPHYSSHVLQRHKIRLLLKLPLPCEEIVVSASGLVRIFMAHARSRLVDRAAARLSVEEHADRFVDVVALMAKHDDAVIDFREAPLRGFRIDAEVTREAIHIALRYLDLFVAAAICGTLAA